MTAGRFTAAPPVRLRISPPSRLRLPIPYSPRAVEIYGDVSESVLFSDVKIGKGAKVEYSILMPGAVVEEGATVRYSIVAEKAVIAKGAEVGGSPSDSDADNWGVAVVAEGVRIGSGAKLAAKEMADEDLPDVK